MKTIDIKGSRADSAFEDRNILSSTSDRRRKKPIYYDQPRQPKPQPVIQPVIRSVFPESWMFDNFESG